MRERSEIIDAEGVRSNNAKFTDVDNGIHELQKRQIKINEQKMARQGNDTSANKSQNYDTDKHNHARQRIEPNRGN